MILLSFLKEMFTTHIKIYIVLKKPKTTETC